MRKLLYIDPYSEFGHVNLNRTFINKLRERGFIVELAVREGYVNEMGLAPSMARVPIPTRYFEPGSGPFVSRLRLLKILRYIRDQVDLRAYDYVFFSAYDEFALFFSGIRARMVLVNHGNVSGMAHPLKRIFVRLVSRQASHVVFAPYIRDRLAHFGIRNVYVEPLGIPSPYEVHASERDEMLRSLGCPGLHAGRRILFAPSGAKYGSNFMRELMKSERFRNFLEEKKLVFVVRSEDGSIVPDPGGIVVLRGVLSEPHYRALFKESAAVLIFYPKSFDYRVSASLFECFSNDKPCFLSEIQAFKVWGSHFNYDPYFKDANSLIRVLEAYFPSGGGDATLPFRDVESLNPSFAWMSTGDGESTNGSSPLGFPRARH